MLKTTLEMLGEEYPRKAKHPEVFDRAFQIHKAKVDAGSHEGQPHPHILCAMEGSPGYCDCYAEAWLELIGVPRAMLHRNPNEDLFDPRL